MSKFICNVCTTDLNTKQIETERKYNIDIAYIDCPECDSRFNMMFDNRRTTRIKSKIRKVKEIEHYLQLQLWREMLLVEDDYYRQAYDDLPAEDKERIGAYVSDVDKDKIKEYNRAIKSKRYDFKDLLKLL